LLIGHRQRFGCLPHAPDNTTTQAYCKYIIVTLH
jgi:hypothetical protein